MQLSKFILGTAQFNGIYGVSNNRELSFQEIEKLILNSNKRKINFIEICSSYGDSQDKIFEILEKKKLKKNFSVLYKFDQRNLESSIKFLTKLIKNRFKIQCVMAHNTKFFLSRKFQFIVEQLKLKKIKIGVSIYTKKEIKKILESKYNVDIIQIPFSIINKDFSDINFFKLMKLNKIKIHTRSIFHQGLIFLDDQEIKSFFKKEYEYFINFRKTLKNKNISIYQLSINWNFLNKNVDKILIGLTNMDELKMLSKCKILKKYKEIKKTVNSFKFNSMKIVDPRIWQKK